MRVPTVLLGLALVVGCVPVLAAQDAAKVDPGHYNVITENSEVRVLHAHYGPHEKSAMMHSHPDAVVVMPTAGRTKFTYPDGKTEITDAEPGDARFTPHTVHLPRI